MAEHTHRAWPADIGGGMMVIRAALAAGVVLGLLATPLAAKAQQAATLFFVGSGLVGLALLRRHRAPAQPQKEETMNKLYATLVVLVAVIMFNPVSARADTWGGPINDPTRFTVLASFNGQGVLDQETGLIWEQSPDTGSRSWIGAQIFCNQKIVGQRAGWRLPTIQELASLVDPTQANPALPVGHPFSNVGLSGSWSATTFVVTTSAWVVEFFGGAVFADPKDEPFFVWCVRGGQGVNPQ